MEIKIPEKQLQNTVPTMKIYSTVLLTIFGIQIFVVIACPKYKTKGTLWYGYGYPYEFIYIFAPDGIFDNAAAVVQTFPSTCVERYNFTNFYAYDRPYQIAYQKIKLENGEEKYCPVGKIDLSKNNYTREGDRHIYRLSELFSDDIHLISTNFVNYIIFFGCPTPKSKNVTQQPGVWVLKYRDNTDDLYVNLGIVFMDLDTKILKTYLFGKDCISDKMLQNDARNKTCSKAVAIYEYTIREMTVSKITADKSVSLKPTIIVFCVFGVVILFNGLWFVVKFILLKLK